MVSLSNWDQEVQGSIFTSGISYILLFHPPFISFQVYVHSLCTDKNQEENRNQDIQDLTFDREDSQIGGALDGDEPSKGENIPVQL